MESQPDEENLEQQYRLWLLPLDEDEAEAVIPVPFSTVDELFQALFARWDHHFHWHAPNGPDVNLCFPASSEEN